MTRWFFKSIWEYVKRSVSETLNPRNLTFYAPAVIIFILFALFVQYTTQVYLSIAAGLAVAVLIAASVILSRGFKTLDLVFIVGILFLIAALLQSDLPTKAVLENFRHFSLFLSVALTGLNVAIEIVQSSRVKLHSKSIQNIGNFFSVCSATLSSELCSCLHPTLFLETLGIVAFLPNQVRLGFVIMMTTLVNQTRLTYRSYKSRRHASTLKDKFNRKSNPKI